MSLIDSMRELRAATLAEMEALVTAAAAEKRDLSDTEKPVYDTKKAQLEGYDERIADLIEAEKREQAAAAHIVETNTAENRGARVINEPNPVYRKGDHTTSFFRDVAVSKLQLAGADQARARLAASQETRAGDMTTSAGAGGEFAPPLWQIADFVALARAGRVTADLCQKDELPSGVSSINLPKVSTGVTVAVQQTQNSALSDTAMTTTSVSSGITTVGGKQIISLQLLQQSGIPFDRVILQDLAKAYAVQVDNQVLYGTNANGQVRGLVGVPTATAFTSATPKVADGTTSANSFYYALSKAAAAVQTAIFEPANAVVMHPNRWAWVVGSADSSNRPLIVPAGPGFNGVGTTGDQVAQGYAGTIGSYNVYTDPNISLTANSATNQDEVYVLRTDQLWLYESAMQTASFDATYADNASILFRVLGYMAFIPNRYTGAVQVLRGTGLVAP